MSISSYIETIHSFDIQERKEKENKYMFPKVSKINLISFSKS